jgi:hypothetical protein
MGDRNLNLIKNPLSYESQEGIKTLSAGILSSYQDASASRAAT